MSLEEMLKNKQYNTGGLEAMVGGSAGGLESMVTTTQPTTQTTTQPDWAKPGPRVAKLNPLTPGYQEITRHQEAIKPYSVQYQKPGDTFTDIRERMRAKTTDPKNSSFMQGNIYQKPLEEMPGFSGFYSAYTMDIPTRFDPETFAKAKEANPLAYNIGRGAGHITKYASGYGALGPVIEGIPALQAIGNPFLRTMATEGAKDLVIGGSIGGLEGLIQGKGPAEIAKDMPKQLAYDALANLVFYGAGKAIKGLKGLRQVDNILPKATTEAAPAWAKSITMPEGKTLQSIDDAVGKTLKRGSEPRPLSTLVKTTDLTVEVPVKRSDIIKMLDEQLNVPVRTGRFNQRAYGIYKVKPEVIRLKTANDIYTLAHEVGHHLDKKLGLGSISTQFDDELLNLGKFTSRKSYSKNMVKAEGVAEFMRYYLLDPEQARKLAPNYFDAFEKKISNTGVKDVLDNVRQQATDFVAQSPIQRVLSQISTGKQPVERITLDKLYAKTFDELQPLKKAVQDMTGGANIPIQKDPFKLAELHRGWVGKAETYLHYGIVDDSFNKVSKSLDEILKPVSNKLDDFRAYAVSRRAIELSQRGIQSGINIEDAVATVNQLNTTEFQKAFTELVKYQDDILNQLVKSGVLSIKDAAVIRTLNQNYVPFYRVFDKSSEGFGKGGFANLMNPVKSIKGSSRDIIDPIESIIKNTYVVTNIAERNKIGKALVELAENTEGAGRWAEKVATPMFGNRFQLDEIAGALRDAGVDMNAIDLEHVATIFRPSIFAPGKENIVTVFRNGKREFWQLQPDLYRAMMTLDKESSNTLIKLLSFPAKMLRAGATLNPEFMVRNPIRDAFTAYVYSKYGFVPGIDTARGLLHVLKKDDLYWKWKAAGGSHGALVSLDRNYLQASIRQITEKSLKDKTLNILKNPIEALRVLSEFGEEATRVAEFAKGLRREGLSKAGIMKAAAASRDVTLDFARAGTASKEINKVVAFFNAALQGTDKMVRQFKADPAGSTVKALTSITLPSIVLYYVNHNNPKYQELPQWQKDFFWIIPVGDKLYRVPKPFELGMIFGTLPERALEFVKSNDKKAFDDYGKNLMEAGAPSIIPTALLPIIEAWANKSMFTNLPIVPQSEARLPAPMQYGPYTSETAKALGNLLDISPRKIDNTIRGYSAGLGGYTTKGIDLLLTGTGIAKSAPKPSTYEPEVPILKGFQVRSDSQSKSVNDFYNELQRLEALYSGVRKRFGIPSGQIVKLEELLNVARQKDIGMKPEDVEKLIVYRKVSTELSNLRQLMSEVERNNELTIAKKKEVITKIQQRMTDLTRVLQGKKQIGGI